MAVHLPFEILPQPDDTTCGPTCLHALYQYYGDERPLEDLLGEVHAFTEGGTLAVFLGCHALRNGYQATIYTYNLNIFDPTWFTNPDVDLKVKLAEQARLKGEERLQIATRGYCEFLELGGNLRFEDLTPGLIRKHLKREHPILTGLSSTFLYRTIREMPITNDDDDLRGLPVGHFVVLCGYDKKLRQVLVADPMRPNPVSESVIYPVRIDRVINAILLGVITNDANLLVLLPPGEPAP